MNAFNHLRSCSYHDVTFFVLDLVCFQFAHNHSNGTKSWTNDIQECKYIFQTVSRLAHTLKENLLHIKSHSGNNCRSVFLHIISSEVCEAKFVENLLQSPSAALLT